MSAFLFCFFIWLQAKCLQSDFNFIANNLRKIMSLRHFSISHYSFTIIGLHIGRHLGYIEMLNDARVASLGFFKDNVCTTRINKEKKFKIKFQVLLKFAQILPDYCVITGARKKPIEYLFCFIYSQQCIIIILSLKMCGFICSVLKKIIPNNTSPTFQEVGG